MDRITKKYFLKMLPLAWLNRTNNNNFFPGYEYFFRLTVFDRVQWQKKILFGNFSLIDANFGPESHKVDSLYY